jgi:hypothetical protein
MGVLLAWAVGYVVGTRAGPKGFDDIVRAVKEVRDSDEVRNLWSAVRAHAAHTLRSTADLLEHAEVPHPAPAGDLVDRVRLMMRKS